jgi:hypothetical protein
MAGGLNAAEKFVAQHCQGTFLSLWGMANPIGKDTTKELCDYFVVCDPHVLIISVKDICLGTELNKAKADRWTRKAIEESAKQVYGAERYLTGAVAVNDHKGRTIILPPSDRRRTHRLCVAFGSEGQVGINMGNFGKGFVHVLDETSFPTILRELDTISDLTDYLEAKCAYLENGPRLITFGEEQLLAFYLSNQRSFPNSADVVLLDETLWPGLVQSKQFQARVAADRISYAWDNVIEYISKDLLAGTLMYISPPTEAEMVLRILAHEKRFYRRSLAEAMNTVIFEGKVRARMVRSMSGIVYVFLAVQRDEDRQYRIAELSARCFAAHLHHRDARIIVGLATESAKDARAGLSFDLFMIDQPDWTEEDEKHAIFARDELGFFKAPQISMEHKDEYPEQ